MIPDETYTADDLAALTAEIQAERDLAERQLSEMRARVVELKDRLKRTQGWLERFQALAAEQNLQEGRDDR